MSPAQPERPAPTRRLAGGVAALALLLLAGCAGVRRPAPAPAPTAAAPAPPAPAAPRGPERFAHHPAPPAQELAGAQEDAEAALRARILDAARARLGTRPALDCSGYVLAALRAAGVELALAPARSRSESLFLASREIVRPRPGDLAFFHDTYDRDRDGRRDDRFTHVALVEDVDGDQVTLLHRGGRRVERIRLDLARPSDPALNDQVRVTRRGDAPGTRYLAGELLAAFGQLLDGDVTQRLPGSPAAATRRRDPPRR